MSIEYKGGRPTPLHGLNHTGLAGRGEWEQTTFPLASLSFLQRKEKRQWHYILTHKIVSPLSVDPDSCLATDDEVQGEESLLLFFGFIKVHEDGAASQRTEIVEMAELKIGSGKKKRLLNNHGKASLRFLFSNR